MMPQDIMSVVKKNGGKLNNDIDCPKWYKDRYVKSDDYFLNTVLEFKGKNSIDIVRLALDEESIYRLGTITVNGNTVDDFNVTKNIIDLNGIENHYLKEDGKNTAKLLDGFLKYSLNEAETPDDVINAFAEIINLN